MNKKLTYLTIVLLLITKLSFSQEFKDGGNIKYSSDAVIIENYKIQKGDTIYTGFGSGVNKQFVFIYYRPNALTYNPAVGLEGVPAMFANSHFVIQSITVKKVLGKDAVDIRYTVGGKKVAVSIDLYNAFKSGEIKAFSERCRIQN